jgi:hypothetical protein
MAQYALESGYDYVFRTDSDAYCWVNRLLASGFENHDYQGWCIDYPKHLETDKALRTAHGGIGFLLSRKAMEIVVREKPWMQSDGYYWGDIWTGEVLWQHGIRCQRDTRFLDGSNGAQHHGNVFASELPLDHPYISVHPLPVLNIDEMHAKFPCMSDETIPPERQLWWCDIDHNYGTKQPECPCDYCATSSPQIL